MAKEIERKFLVTSDSYQLMADRRIDITQGYLSTTPEATVRVRIADDKAYITIKGKNSGIVRNEWEYPIPVAEALQMLQACKCPTLQKVRYIVMYGGHKWEVDEFYGRHAGLVLAEIEIPAVDHDFPLPPFVGKEVSEDPKYYNSNLSLL